MKLIDHLRAAEKSVAAFASEISEAENTVRKIVYGQRQPSLPLAVKIAAATGGVVTEADLLLPQSLHVGDNIEPATVASPGNSAAQSPSRAGVVA